MDRYGPAAKEVLRPILGLVFAEVTLHFRDLPNETWIMTGTSLMVTTQFSDPPRKHVESTLSMRIQRKRPLVLFVPLKDTDYANDPFPIAWRELSRMYPVPFRIPKNTGLSQPCIMLSFTGGIGLLEVRTHYQLLTPCGVLPIEKKLRGFSDVERWLREDRLDKFLLHAGLRVPDGSRWREIPGWTRRWPCVCLAKQVEDGSDDRPDDG